MKPSTPSSAAPRAFTARQRRLLAAGIRSEIKHLQRCLRLLPLVDREVYAAGRDLFTTDAALALWLCQPARSLDGKIPMRRLRPVKGRREVAGILGAIANGVYL